MFGETISHCRILDNLRRGRDGCGLQGRGQEPTPQYRPSFVGCV